MPKLKSPSDAAAEPLVINTGPLIALARADALDILEELPFAVICPPEVRAELDAGPLADRPFIVPSWLTVVPLDRPLDVVARTTLDAGEAAVIQLALERSVRWVCIDERRGRQTARAVGLQVVGTLGLLLRAKNLGILAAIRPRIEGLLRAGEWYDAALIERVLRAAGEASEAGPS